MAGAAVTDIKPRDVPTPEVEALMRKCQRGCGGRNALDDAHSIMADCYGTLGALVQQRDALMRELDAASNELKDWRS